MVPKALNGGEPCEGTASAFTTCNDQACPAVNCSYMEWSSWGMCTLTCGDGTKMRTRAITQLPLHGGASCTDPLAEISQCKETCTTTMSMNPTTQAITTTTTPTTTAGPSKFIMVTQGNQSPYRPHFFSLSPSTNPLPSCLSGTKQELRGRDLYNAALFAGEGIDYLSNLKHDWWLLTISFKHAMFIWMIPYLNNIRTIFSFFSLPDKQPTICGGGSASEHDKRRCMKYDAASDQWSFVATNAVGGG